MVNKGAILNFSQYADYRGKFKLCYYFETLLWLPDVNKR